MSLFDGTSGPQISVELTLDTDPAARVWSALPSDDLLRTSMRRGRSRPDDSNEVGTLVVELTNVSGDYDPENVLSSWYEMLQMSTPVRLVAAWDGTDYVLWTGFIDSVDVDHGFTPTVTITGVDAVSRIANTPTTVLPDALYNAKYDGEPVYYPSSTDPLMLGRVWRLWDLTSGGTQVGLSAFLSDIDIPETNLLRKQSPIRKGSNFMQILDECATVTGGRWWVTKDNRLHMETAYYVYYHPDNLHLSDDRAEGTIEYDTFTVSPGASLLVNDCRLNTPGRNGNDQQHYAQWDASVAAYGIKSWSVSAPVYDADWADTLAAFYARRFAEPKSYVSHVEFDAFALDTLYPDLLGTELNDVVWVERTTVDGRNLNWFSVVEGIGHDMTPESWRVSFDMSPAHGFYPAL